MAKLENVVNIISGSPQFRIEESFDLKAPVYTFYSQADLNSDLVNSNNFKDEKKTIRTLDKVSLLQEGDVVFSMVSGMATLVRKCHEDYIFTHNYLKLVPTGEFRSGYLVYLLNEDSIIQKQFKQGLQGSQVMKYSVGQLKGLEIPELPSVKVQKYVENIYFKQLRVEALKKEVAEKETLLRKELLKGAIANDRK